MTHARKQDLHAICVTMQTKQKKKRKGSDIFKETTTHYDIPSQHACAITSFEGFVQNQHVLPYIFMSIALSSKVLLVFSLAEIFIKI